MQCLLLQCQAQPLDATEREICKLTNDYRATHHLSAVVLDSTLSEIARGHSEEMLTRGFFAHESPNQICKRVSDRLRFGYRFCLTSAENLHKTQGYPVGMYAKASFASWSDSPSHRRNLLNPQYNRTGIGVAHKGNVALFTQIFTYEPILIETMDVTEASGGYEVNVKGRVADGPPRGSWFVNGKRTESWEADETGAFSSRLFLAGPGELDVGQADGRLSWSVQTTIPIPPPIKHFRHTSLDWKLPVPESAWEGMLERFRSFL